MGQTEIVVDVNTVAKIHALERASVIAVECSSTTPSTLPLRKSPHGHWSTLPRPPTPCASDNSTPVQPACFRHAGDDGTRHHGGPCPVGRHRGQGADRATLFLHRAPVGHPV